MRFVQAQRATRPPNGRPVKREGLRALYLCVLYLGEKRKERGKGGRKERGKGGSKEEESQNGFKLRTRNSIRGFVHLSVCRSVIL